MKPIINSSNPSSGCLSTFRSTLFRETETSGVYPKHICSMFPDKCYRLSSYHFRSGNAHRRFTTYFGPLNSNVSIGDHHFVFFDAPGYVDEDTKRHGMRLEVYQWNPLAGGSLDYLVKLSKSTGVSISVLLASHSSSQEFRTAPPVHTHPPLPARW